MSYQPGDRIALVYTSDPYTRLKPGDEGIVISYGELFGQLSVRWDSDSTLMLLLRDGDHVRKVVKKT